MMTDEDRGRKVHRLSPREVAVELTLMDAELLRKIQPCELKEGAWMNKAKKDELAPNVMAMVRSFNRLALLVPTEILEEKTPQARSKVITSFIQIASKCYRFHNYNSLKAILAGLQCTPIYRLKKTWKEVPSKRRKKFEQLSALMSEECNFQLYHKDLQQTLAANIPCMPFLGTFLTTVVQQDSYSQMTPKKQSALLETYTVLDAITVRHRLEKMQQQSFEAPSPPSSPLLLNGDASDDSTTEDVAHSSFHIPESGLQQNVEESLRFSVPTDATSATAHTPAPQQLGIESAVTQVTIESAPSNNTPHRKLNPRQPSFEYECLLDPRLSENSRERQISRSTSLTSLKSHNMNGVTSDLSPSHPTDVTCFLPVQFSRKRRLTADVPKLHVAQVDHSSSPLDLLSCYQFLTVGGSVELVSRPELRAILSDFSHNSEGQNYKLSYEREPES